MSSVVPYDITSEAEAILFLELALDGNFDNQSVMFRFNGWPRLDIDIAGERYDSSLPTGVMRALIDYQSAINRVYASVVYGRSAKALTEDDRKDVELVFDVRQGSTDADSKLWGVLTQFSEKAVEKMTGNHLVITVIGCALIAGGYFASIHWMDTQAAISADNSKTELFTKMLEQNQHLAQLNNDVSKAAMNLVKGAYDADRLAFGDVHLDKHDIESINRRGRESMAIRRIDGAYEITQLKRYDDRWRVALYSDTTGTVQTDLYRGQKAFRCIEELSAAFAKGDKVDLLVLGRYKSDTLQSATILGSANSGLLEPELARRDDPEEDEGE